MYVRLGTTIARFALVTVGIIVVTSFSIDATDSLRGSQTALSRLAGEWTDEECAAGTVRVPHADQIWCVDQFEAAPAMSCPHPITQNSSHTAANVKSAECVPESSPERQPWTHVAYHQADTLCARAGKQLLPADVWYRAALGTPASACHTNGSAPQLTRADDCVSGVGTYGMVGNVWELVAGQVEAGVYDGHELPPEGYVHAIAANGLPSETAATATELFDEDYLWSTATGTHVLMRGGFYGSRSDAGLYAVHAAIDPTFSSQAIGFRCAETL